MSYLSRYPDLAKTKRDKTGIEAREAVRKLNKIAGEANAKIKIALETAAYWEAVAEECGNALAEAAEENNQLRARIAELEETLRIIRDHRLLKEKKKPSVSVLEEYEMKEERDRRKNKWKK